jgi:hypothetical protein
MVNFLDKSLSIFNNEVIVTDQGGGRMGFLGRLLIRSIIVIWIIACSATLAGAQGKTEDDKALLGLIQLQECEGVKVTQCELAKNLILTLKMGDDLTCEASFIQIQSLGIAPGADWSYADPHKVVTVDEIKEIVLEIHHAYNNGMVRYDGPEVAAGVNRFCRDIKGPSAILPPSKTEKKETETAPASPAQEPKEQGPASAQEPEKKEGSPPSGTQGSDTQLEGGT